MTLNVCCGDKAYYIASLGLFSIQLAKLSGYKVVTTVSPKNFEIAKSLGADVVVDVSTLSIRELKREHLTPVI